MLILIGYLIILASVFGGFAMAGGHLKAILQPIELLIIAGAAIGSVVVGNNLNVLKALGKALPSIIKSQKPPKQLHQDILKLLFSLLTKARMEGLMSLENDIDNPASSSIFSNYPRVLAKPILVDFICDSLRLVVTSNIQPSQLEALMDTEIDTHLEEEMLPSKIITKLADGMPAFGIVAAVLGVVHTMESIDLPPAELGVLVAQALVGTFLGILLGYGFVGPLGNKLELKAQNTHIMLISIKETILASLHNNPPIVAVEFGRKVLFTAERPTFNQLNDEVKSR